MYSGFATLMVFSVIFVIDSRWMTARMYSGFATFGETGLSFLKPQMDDRPDVFGFATERKGPFLSSLIDG